jgi:hypothetical protein
MSTGRIQILNEITYTETIKSKSTKLAALQAVSDWYTQRHPGQQISLPKDSLPEHLTINLPITQYNDDTGTVALLFSKVNKINASEFHQQAQEIMT